MALREGEVIEQIEQLDEGWWSGVSADGTRSGLFPGMSSSVLGVMIYFANDLWTVI